MLQAEMLKFHKEISPVKKQERQTSLESQTEESKFVSTCIFILFVFLKILVCLVGLTACPAIVYCIEGSSNLFWQVAVISSIITLLLATMVVTLMCMKIKTVQRKVSEMLQSLKTLCSKCGPFRVFWDVLNSDFLKRNVHKVIYPTMLLFTSTLMSYIAYKIDNRILFYASLVLIGFISGIITTIMRDILRHPELLPYHSPCKIKMEYASPSSSVKKELEFEAHGDQDLTTTFHLLTPNTVLQRENPDSAQSSTATSVLPTYSSSIDHEEMGRTKLYHLPFDFGKFFRELRL